MLTGMAVPLGLAVGNAGGDGGGAGAAGGGPTDVAELPVALAGEMLALAGITGIDPAAVLASGAAYPTWCRMISAQDGDPSAPLPVAAHVHEVRAPGAGVLGGLDALRETVEICPDAQAYRDRWGGAELVMQACRG